MAKAEGISRLKDGCHWLKPTEISRLKDGCHWLKPTEISRLKDGCHWLKPKRRKDSWRFTLPNATSYISGGVWEKHDRGKEKVFGAFYEPTHAFNLAKFCGYLK